MKAVSRAGAGRMENRQYGRPPRRPRAGGYFARYGAGAAGPVPAQDAARLPAAG